MAMHLSPGINVQSYVVIFRNEIVKIVNFRKPFVRPPYISLTLGRPGSSPSIPWTVSVSSTRCVIRFQVRYSGQVNLLAMQTV